MKDSFDLFVPCVDENKKVTINKGSVLFMLGSNGAGKSSLLYKIIKDIGVIDDVVLISAHRQIYFDNSIIDMSNDEYSNVVRNVNLNALHSNNARWKINDSRSNKLPIIRLKKAINRRNRDVANKFDDNDLEGAREVERPPLLVINSILESLGMPINLYLDDEDNISVLNKKYSPPINYSISELSDGEKNAINISSDIISSPSGTIFIIDEPERHLHRSISSVLLSKLVSIRPDCFFIISTHDIGLASDMENSKILLIKSCYYDEDGPSYWDAELIINPLSIPDEIRKDILGSKNKVIFVEGVNNSLDSGLYKAIFPDATIISKGGCDNVATSVRGIRRNEVIGWVSAFGIVDNDNKNQEEIDSLLSDNIFTLKYHSIESIFYHPFMIYLFIKNFGEFLFISESVLTEMEKNFILVFNDDTKRDDLCSLAVNNLIRLIYNKNTPSHKDGFKNKTFTVNAGDIYMKEISIYSKAISQNDFNFLVERYSIRRTGIISKIIRILNCPNKEFYEAKIIELVKNDKEAKKFVIECLSGLDKAVQSED